MSRYTSSIFVAVPEALLPIAPPIAQAFDPDTGGSKSFDVIRATKEGTTYAICFTPATEQTAGGLSYFKSVAGALYQYVQEDFATRWPEQICPTLEECEAFRTAIDVVTGMSMQAALAHFGMTLVVSIE
jgi:hypothetical protein